MNIDTQKDQAIVALFWAAVAGIIYGATITWIYLDVKNHADTLFSMYMKKEGRMSVKDYMEQED